MSSNLLVPTRLDGILLPKGATVLSPHADFSVLPWVDSNAKPPRDRNTDTAWLSENVVAQPFNDRDLWLHPGFHLHWALPDALTVGRHPVDGDGRPVQAAQPEYAAAPNRWLIVRTGGKNNAGALKERHWIVESDHIRPPEWGFQAVAHPLSNPKQGEAPFVHLGRTRELAAGRESPPKEALPKFVEDPGEVYLSSRAGEMPLTSLGYGEPNFAAFYPNCYSAFGLRDPDFEDATAEHLEGVKYEVIGWYSKPEIDPLVRFREDRFSKLSDAAIRENLNLPDDHTLTSADRVVAFHRAFERHFGWNLPAHAIASVDGGILHTADGPLSGLTLHATLDLHEPVQASNGEVADLQVAVGSTGTEALAAWTAHELAGDDSKKKLSIENQLEALTLSPHLQHQAIDLNPKFREARHTKAFTPVTTGSHLWTLREEPRDRTASTAANQPGLPPALAAQVSQLVANLDWELQAALADILHPLNQLQLAYDRGRKVIEDLRRELYSDWNKYMVCGYRPPEAMRADDYPPIDAVREMLGASIAWLRLVEFVVGELDPKSGKPVDLSLCERDVPDQAIARLGMQLRQRFASTSSAASEDLAIFGETLLDDTFVTPYRQFVEGNTTSLPEPVWRLLSDEILPTESSLHDTIVTDSGEVSVLPLAGRLHVAISEARKLEESISRVRDKIPEKPAGVAQFNKALDELVKSVPDAKQPSDALRKFVEVAALDALPGLALTIRTCFVVRKLHQIPAPRYWTPNEPVLLLSGADVEPTDRHGRDGRLLVRPTNSDVRTGLVGKDTETRARFLVSFRNETALVAAEAKQFSDWKKNWEEVTQQADTRQKMLEDYVADQNKSIVEGQRAAVCSAGFETLFETLKDRIRRWVEECSRGLLNAFASSNGNPWHPLLMEWEVRILSCQGDDSAERGRSNVSPKTRRYDSEYFARNYSLRGTASSLVKDRGKLNLEASSSLFTGRSILTPHAREQLVHDIDDYLKWYEKQKQAGAENGDLHPDPELLETLNNARELLAREDAHLQSQALTGFNAALLMRRQTLQLPVLDPAAFPDAVDFANKAAGAIGRQNRVAPAPQWDFHPVRAGAIHLLRLRLVDTFGRIRRVELENPDKPVITTEPLSELADRKSSWIGLRPRISQPSRVNFRWLNGESDSQETNAIPLTSPVCGWVLPNNLDGSLMVYTSDGEPLGYIDTAGRWRPPPGGGGPVIPFDIPNRHLAKMVQWIVETASQSEDTTHFMRDYIDVIDRGLEAIDPETWAAHESRALLVARPMALVRAMVNIEPLGLPATHQGWEPLRRRLNYHPPETQAWQNVTFPVRIGEYRQQNDGVVGYWLEDDKGKFAVRHALTREALAKLKKTDVPPEIAAMLERMVDCPHIGKRRFMNALREQIGKDAADQWGIPIAKAASRGVGFFAPQSQHRTGLTPEKHPVIYEHAGRSLNFFQSVADPPQVVSMLVDPRGLVHCTTGVLPTKSLSIPTEHYAEALKNLQVTFLTAPLLTPTGRIEVPLPSDPGWSWSWLDRGRDGWREMTRTPTVLRDAFVKAFPDGYDIWSELIDKGWLTPFADDDSCAYVRPDGAHRKPLEHEYSDDIQRVLEISEQMLGPTHEEARFGSALEIREGWLRWSEMPPPENDLQTQPDENTDKP